MHRKRRKKKIIKGILFAILLLGVVGGFCYYKEFIKKNTKEEKKTVEKKKMINRIEDDEVKQSIFKKEYKRAVEIVSNMTLKEKIGQLFLVRYEKNDVEYLSNFTPGGYILFAKDFNKETKEEMIEEIKKAQSLHKYGLILGVDEEGGYVTRISRYKIYREDRFLSPKSYFEEGGYPLLEKMENEKYELLKSLGINLNLAPVADISTNSEDFINNRAFGYGAKETSEFVGKMVEYANNNGISSCLKHFPGYGNNKDTHTGSAVDERSYENFIENDFLPFEAGIKKNVPSILVSHNIVKSMDEEYPASLSKKVMNELRNTLHFTGVITTDDLSMDAVKEYVEKQQAATLAINAGIDMIMTSNFLPMYHEILDGVESKTIKEETINKAALRVIAWKLHSKIMK